jgi:hypothetical protein
MYNERLTVIYKALQLLAFLCSVAFLLHVLVGVPPGKDYGTELILAFVLFAALSGITGFFTGGKFTVLGEPNLDLPEAGTDVHDERRAWGLTIAIFYLCIFVGAVAIYAS